MLYLELQLKPHPDTPPQKVDFVSATVSVHPEYIWIVFVIGADTSDLSLPTPAKPYRTDGLWRTTCLELFVGLDGEEYLEFNFSPSSQWAAYRFAAYREEAEPVFLDDPPLIRTTEEGSGGLAVSVTVKPPAPVHAKINLSAVVEEVDGNKSYWALAHAPGPPDFHNPDCFIATLPAPSAS
jgi:hypothetical protein